MENNNWFFETLGITEEVEEKIHISKKIINEVYEAIKEGCGVIVETSRYIIEIPQSFIDDNLEWGDSTLEEIADEATALIIDNADFIYAV
jgi:hypothetical protein